MLSYLANDMTKVITEDSNPLKVNFSGDNDFISFLPLNHIAERVVVEHTCFRFGGTISFVESLETFSKKSSRCPASCVFLLHQEFGQSFNLEFYQNFLKKIRYFS